MDNEGGYHEERVIYTLIIHINSNIIDIMLASVDYMCTQMCGSLLLHICAHM